MATIDISRTHTLGKEEAKNRANTILEKMKSSAGIKGTWSGDTFNIESPAKGTFKVSDNLVRIELDLPLMMRPLKGTIESKINSELDRSLA
jgi:putative polyhydroxyalkanoate system protein